MLQDKKVALGIQDVVKLLTVKIRTKEFYEFLLLNSNGTNDLFASTYRWLHSIYVRDLKSVGLSHVKKNFPCLNKGEKVVKVATEPISPLTLASGFALGFFLYFMNLF